MLSRLRMFGTRICALAMCVVLATPIVAQDEDKAPQGKFKRAVSDAVDKIEKYLKDKGRNDIGVGDFQLPADSGAAARGVRKAFTDEMTARKIDIRETGAEWTLTGELVSEIDRGIFKVVINLRVKDRRNKTVVSFPEDFQSTEFTDEGDIASLLGLNVDVSKEKADSIDAIAKSEDKTLTGAQKRDATDSKLAAGETLARKLDNSIVSPETSLKNTSGTQLGASKDSDFSIELLVQKQGKGDFIPLPIKSDSNVASVEGLEAGDIYVVRVHNNASHDVGVKVSIDGINTFEFAESPDRKSLGMWLVPRKSSGHISGWYVRDGGPGNIRRFLVTTEDDTLDGLPPVIEKDSFGQGMVSVQFFHAWGEDEQRPDIELLASRVPGGLKTKQGPAIDKQIQLKRSFFGQEMLASISVRYSFPQDLPPE